MAKNKENIKKCGILTPLPLREKPMDVGLLRLVWSLVEDLPTTGGGWRSGEWPVKWVIDRLEGRRVLSYREKCQVKAYLIERTPLIRDIKLG